MNKYQKKECSAILISVLIQSFQFKSEEHVWCNEMCALLQPVSVVLSEFGAIVNKAASRSAILCTKPPAEHQSDWLPRI